MERVAAIWYRALTDGDFFHLERTRAAGPSGGGGQLYVDIPTQVRRALFRFFRLAEPSGGTWPAIARSIATVGAPHRVATLRFELNRKGEQRYRIALQNRQVDNSERHPAWTAEFGFPQAPDSVADVAEAGSYLPDGGARLYLVRTESGALYAGHVQGASLPTTWPAGHGLEGLFAQGDPGGLIEPKPGNELFLEPESRSTPFKVAGDWSSEEDALLLEAYLAHGATPTGDVLEDLRARIRDRLGVERSRSAVIERLRQLGEADPVAEADADPDAERVWDQFGRDADVLREAVESGQAPPVQLEGTAETAEVQTTTVESAHITQYRVRGTEGTIAERREQKLVLEYEAYLKASGHEVTAHIYRIPGSPRRLRCDLFDETDVVLTEAKGIVSREAVRMAVGELLDYARFEKRETKLRVLLPSRPAADLLDLAHSIGASVVWKTQDGFELSAPD